MSFSLDLLAQARTLIDSDPTRPRQATVRRAVSTAYHALFHFVGDESVKLLIGARHQDRPRRELARRAVTHRKLKEVCKEFLKPVPKPVLQPLWATHDVVGNQELRTLCVAVLDLQELAHSADYDLQATIRKSDAVDACDTADMVMAAWSQLQRRHREVALLFATVTLLWPGLSSR